MDNGGLPQLMYVPSSFSYREDVRSMLMMDMLELSETLKGAIIITPEQKAEIMSSREREMRAKEKRVAAFIKRHPYHKRIRRASMRNL